MNQSNAVPILLAACALSLVINFVAIRELLQQRDEITLAGADLATAQADTTLARAAAEACSASVEHLQRAAAEQETQLAAARAAAVSQAQARNARADAVLASPPPVPGDVCASASERFATWQLLRRKEGGLP